MFHVEQSGENMKQTGKVECVGIKPNTAEQFIEKSQSMGHIPTIDGEWIKWTPPLPVVMMIEAGDLADEIAVILTNEIKTIH